MHEYGLEEQSLANFGENVEISGVLYICRGLCPFRHQQVYNFDWPGDNNDFATFTCVYKLLNVLAGREFEEFMSWLCVPENAIILTSDHSSSLCCWRHFAVKPRD